MEDTTLVTATLNDPLMSPNLRTGNLVRETGVKTDRMVEEIDRMAELSDQVELSPEAQALYRLGTANLNNANEVVPATAENESENQVNQETNYPRNETNTATLETTTPTEEETTTAPPYWSETETTTVEQPSTTEQTTQGSVEETPPLLERGTTSTEELAATTITQNEEATRSAQENTAAQSTINEANGAASGQQYDQQVLLQEISTQLAQTVPVANIVSVLG